MVYEYLDDYAFLEALDKSPVRTHYAKLTLLSFDERPIKEIQGEITAGTLNVNGNSPIRRTLSLTMRGSPLNSDLENIDNEISINKKVKVEIGLKNTLNSYLDKYGEIIWFPCGIFILSSGSISRATNSWTISISGKDKMCMLDGSVGGMLPAATSFHDREEEQADGSIVYTYPTIYQIIFEAVNHFGGEKPENIVIEDLEETVKLLVRYIGSSPIYFNDDYSGFSYKQGDGFNKKISQNDDAGFEMTDFTYPGELILKAGDSVVTLLDKITKTLGNFEFFYDLDGRFVFRQIRNYLNTQSPLKELEAPNYLESYDNKKYSFSLTDLTIVTQLRKNPKFESIKNNYYVWGKRTTASGVDVPIRYHLAIDEKPELDFALKNMYQVRDCVEKIVHSQAPFGHISTEYEPGNLILRYEFDTDNNKAGPHQVGDNQYEYWVLLDPPAPQGGWREELYRKALQAQATNGVYDNAYDAEMISEWRKLFDPSKGGDHGDWRPYGWNPAIDSAPSSLDFWIDIIDTDALAKYSVKQIGRRTCTIQNDSLNSIYNKDAPSLLFISVEDRDNQEILNFAQDNGLKYFQLTDSTMELFASSTTNKSCFEEIREQMYQHLTYNTSINITCLPKYYIEPNNVIFINDKDTGIYGNYLITQFSIPLTYNGTMSIVATEILNRDNIGGSL